MNSLIRHKKIGSVYYIDGQRHKNLSSEISSLKSMKDQIEKERHSAEQRANEEAQANEEKQNNNEGLQGEKTDGHICRPR